MLEYLAKSLSAFVAGFTPFLEIYIAIPGAIFGLGLDYVSAAVWCTIGNYLPVPAIVLFHERLSRMAYIGPWLARLSSGRSRRILDRHGPAFLILATPWISVWPVTAAAAALGMNRNKVMLYILISLVGYAIVLTALIALGVEWWTGEH
jgi:hypothetical protein